VMLLQYLREITLCLLQVLGSVVVWGHLALVVRDRCWVVTMMMTWWELKLVQRSSRGSGVHLLITR